MHKITAILVDDEIKNSELLQIYLERHCPIIEVVDIATTSNDAVEKINEIEPKVIFLDIVLDKGTGFDVLEQIQYDDFLVVFITAFQEYALTAFKFNAIDFLLKPIDPKDLILSVEKIKNSLDNQYYTTPAQIESLKDSIVANTSNYNFIAIPSIRKIHFKQLEDILFFESDGRYTIVHLYKGGTIVVAKNIGEYDKILSPTYFFRIHKKYLINIKYIVNINNTDGSNCEMEGNIVLPVAKRRKEELVAYLNIS